MSERDVRDSEDGDDMDTDGREVLRMYGLDPDGMSRSEVLDALELEGESDAESVIAAVLDDADYPVRLPGYHDDEDEER
jgi:hypothetical protein